MARLTSLGMSCQQDAQKIDFVSLKGIGHPGKKLLLLGRLMLSYLLNFWKACAAGLTSPEHHWSVAGVLVLIKLSDAWRFGEQSWRTAPAATVSERSMPVFTTSRFCMLLKEWKVHVPCFDVCFSMVCYPPCGPVQSWCCRAKLSWRGRVAPSHT